MAAYHEDFVLEGKDKSYQIYQKFRYSSHVVEFVFIRPIAMVHVIDPDEEDPYGDGDPDPADEQEFPVIDCFLDHQAFEQASAFVDYYFEDLNPLALALVPVYCSAPTNF